MIDLQSFCSDDDVRVTLRRPFSYGKFTYATNGVFAVRIDRLDEVPEIQKPAMAEQLDKIMSPADGASFKPIDISLPGDIENTSEEECGDCDGRGKEHECPDCECECTSCDGSGRVSKADKISVSAFGDIYRLPYLRQVLGLPGIEIADLPRSLSAPALFRFDGGIAALMLMRAEQRLHVQASASPLPQVLKPDSK
jgi:hypothetical protein